MDFFIQVSNLILQSTFKKRTNTESKNASNFQNKKVPAASLCAIGTILIKRVFNGAPCNKDMTLDDAFEIRAVAWGILHGLIENILINSFIFAMNIKHCF